MIREFKPGDRVQQKHGGPIMEVIKYTLDHQKLVSDHHVECSWYENATRKEGVFDQRTLFKVTHGCSQFED